MSSVINNNTNEDVQAVAAPPRGEKVLSKGELFSTSLGVMTMTASQMLESFGVQSQNSSHSANNNFPQDDLMTQMMLNDQTKRLEKGERMEEALIRALGTELMDPKKGTKTEGAPNSKQTNASKGKKSASSLKQTDGPDGNKYTGKNAIFQAAGLVSSLQKNAQDSLVQQMQNEIKVMEAQLKALEKVEEFIAKYQAAYDAYKADPKNEVKWQALLNVLKEYYKNDPNMLKKLDQLDKDHKEAVKKQNEWDSKSGFHKWWDNLWGIDQDKRYAMSNFNAELAPICLQAEKSACGDPKVFQDLVTNGLKCFSARIQTILTQMTQLLIILSILEGGKGSKDAIFKAEALIMSLMETAIKNNSKKNKDQTEMADINIKIQNTNYSKAQDALKKLEKAEHSHHHGIFGWLEDLVSSLIDAAKKLCEDIVKTVSDVATGNWSDAWKDIKDMPGISGLVTMINDFAKGDILQGFEDLATEVVLYMILGPVGPLLANTSFGKDIHNAVKLAVDCVVALGAIVTAGLEYVFTGGQDMKDFHTLVNAAKEHGIAIIENPALQAVADIAMIAVIVASCLSGQFWLAGIMTVLLVMNDATVGGKTLMQQLTGGIASVLVDMGVSEESAKWIADVIVIVAVMIATVGVGGAPAVADEGLEDGIEMVDMSADGVANATSDATESASESEDEIVQTFKQKASEIIQKSWDAFKSKASNLALRAGQAIKAQAGTALMAGGMMMGATNFAVDFAKSVAKNDKELQLILEILLEVVAILATVGGGIAAASGDGFSAFDQKAGSLLKNILPDLDSNAASYANMARKLQAGGMLVQGATNVASGVDMIIVGKIMKELKQVEGVITLMKSAEDLNQLAMKSNQSDLKKLTQENIQFVKNMDAPSLASLGNARALEQLA